MNKIYLLLVMLLVATGPAVWAQGNTTRYYVSKNGDDSKTGTSWAEAFKTPQKALSVAVSGDSIWVAGSTYYPDEGREGQIMTVPRISN